MKSLIDVVQGPDDPTLTNEETKSTIMRQRREDFLDKPQISNLRFSLLNMPPLIFEEKKEKLLLRVECLSFFVSVTSAR